MRMGRTLALAAAAGVACVGALAADPLYGFDIPKRLPKAYAAYSKVVPPAYARIGWVRNLDGTGAPVDHVDVAGVPSVLFWMCEPHNCGGNELTVLLAKDGSRAAALLFSTDHTGGKPVYFGKPGPTEQDMLRKAMQK
jgi:hypothetical protein